jgi:hypothetical protein
MKEEGRVTTAGLYAHAFFFSTPTNHDTKTKQQRKRDRTKLSRGSERDGGQRKLDFGVLDKFIFFALFIIFQLSRLSVSLTIFNFFV